MKHPTDLSTPSDHEMHLSNNTSEHALLSVAIGRKNDLFIGSQTGRPYRLHPDRYRHAEWC